MLNLLKNKMQMYLGIGLLVAAGSAAAMTKLYLGKRDELASQVVLTQLETARAHAHRLALTKEEMRRRELEGLRVSLSEQISQLESREVDTITEIHEVWRDREVIVENRVAVECADEPMPAAVVRLLCEANQVRAGACGLPSGS